MIEDIVKVFVPAALAFGVGILVTPGWSGFLYRRELWKKKPRERAPDGRETLIFRELHKTREVGTPRMGGVIIWLSAALTVALVSLAAHAIPGTLTEKLDFLSRDQTWIPLAALLIGGLVGLVDDIFDIRGRDDYIGGGLSLRKRLLIVGGIGLLASLWFFAKLGVQGIGLPFVGELPLGILFIPLFVLVTMFLYAGGIIDGIDGLAGGIFAILFSAYGAIAFAQGQINLAAFCAAVVGGTLAFLWFNIPPARFYMSETGTMALTLALAVVVFMTDAVGEGHSLIVLPIIAMPLLITVASVVIQLASKRFRNGAKVFLIAPLHHHFEAIGWPAYKVTMRYWVLGIVFAIIGTALALVG